MLRHHKLKKDAKRNVTYHEKRVTASKLSVQVILLPFCSPIFFSQKQFTVRKIFPFTFCFKVAFDRSPSEEVVELLCW